MEFKSSSVSNTDSTLRFNTNYATNTDEIPHIERNSTKSSQLSFVSNKTSPTELIQRILNSLKPPLNLKCSSNNTIHTSLSSINQETVPCQPSPHLDKFIIKFKEENELGIEPKVDDLIEKIHPVNDRMEINFNNHILNEELSYKQKLSILRIILRRQQIFDRYFFQYNR